MKKNATLSLDRPHDFYLSAASDFYAGFVPGSGMARAEGRDLTFAFRLDDTFEAVAVSLREDGERLVGEVAGTDDVEAVSRQVARILGLDADAERWREVGDRDPVVARLKAAFPGFFTAAKPSPYDAAAWGVIVPRMSMRQASAIKKALAERWGDAVEKDGVVHHVFPSPARLLAIDAHPGLSEEKLLRLKAVAVAALEGRLSAERLRAMPVDAALADLETIRGIGPWTAGHVLFRGAALHDGLPTTEPRVLAGLAAAYDLPSPSTADLERVAEAWRPFRMWVSILLVRHLARTGGFHQDGFARERRRLGDRAKRERGARSAPISRSAL